MKPSFPILLLLFTLVFCSNYTLAQELDSSLFNEPVYLDEVVIRAKEEGFDVQKFIRIIQNDTTFYKAFRSLHLQTYNAQNDMLFLDKKGNKTAATFSSETKQIYRDGCRTMNVLDEKTTGDFYTKKGNYRYFTAEMFADLFFINQKICGENNIVKGHLEKEGRGKGRVEKSKIQLKYLLFNPGHSVPGLPFIGNKVSIFDPKIAKMYDFKIIAEEKNGFYCYLFEAKSKPQYKSELVIQEFKTWLRESDYAIVSRDYSLIYKAGIFDFDVDMHVDLMTIKNQLLPSYISYRGNWYLFTQGRERGRFSVRFYY